MCIPVNCGTWYIEDLGDGFRLKKGEEMGVI